MSTNEKVQKNTKTRSLVVKSLWIIFIIIMIILLLYSMINVIRARQEYYTTTKTISEAASLFPAITICPYQPFSKRAVEYFEKGGLSPKEFSQKLRRSAVKDLVNNEPLKVESTIFYDDLRIYYQNLPYNNTISIGLNHSEIFVFCITKLRYMMIFGNVDENCGYTITRYSSPDFFNCYTINIQPKYSKYTQYIHLILRFPKLKVLNKYREKALLNSLSQNIVGAQLLVHESNSYPLSKREKIHIEPNRLVQINYQNIYWPEYGTPSDICQFDESESIKDLENKYRFSFQECLSSYNGKRILEKCGCIMAFLPRSVIPSPEAPYCANFQNLTEKGFQNFKNRSKCIQSTLSSLDKMSSSEKKCSKKCEFKKFILQISGIHWEPNLWQLEWLYKLQKSWNILIDEPKGNSKSQTAKNLVMQFLKSNNVSNGEMIFRKDENYACVVLERSEKESFYTDRESVFGYDGKLCVSVIPHFVLLCVFLIEIVRSLAVIWKGKHNQGTGKRSRNDKGIPLKRQEVE